MSRVSIPLRSTALGLLLVIPAWCAEPLPAALLEFMADFALEDGEWVDPVDLALMAEASAQADADQPPPDLYTLPNQGEEANHAN